MASNWRSIPSAFFPQGGHMGFDERSFETFQKGNLPILRFFYYKEPTFTFGRLEARRIAKHRTSLAFPAEVRPTGGRGVLHGKDDLCYSLIAPTQDPLVGGDLLSSYRKISLILASGLKDLGREVELSEEKHRALGPGHCFTAPSQGELLWKGLKVAGGAQARRGDVFLQQGVILLSVSDLWKKAYESPEVERMIGLNEGHSGRKITRVELEKAMVQAFEKAGVFFAETLRLSE